MRDDCLERCQSRPPTDDTPKSATQGDTKTSVVSPWEESRTHGSRRGDEEPWRGRENPGGHRAIPSELLAMADELYRGSKALESRPCTSGSNGKKAKAAETRNGSRRGKSPEGGNPMSAGGPRQPAGTARNKPSRGGRSPRAERSGSGKGPCRVDSRFWR